MRLFFLLPILFPAFGFAKEVYFGQSPVRLAIRWEMLDPLNPKLGLRPTYLRFPKSVYRFDNVTLFSVEAAKKGDFSELKIYPRKSNGGQQVEIVLQDRTVIRAQFTISNDENVALSYDFRPEKIPNLDEANEDKVFSELDVMREILSGKVALGMKEKKLDARLTCIGRGIQARALRSIEGLGFKVFQVKISNSTQEDFKFLPHRIHFSDRDLAKSELKHLESEILRGKETTVLTILGDERVNIMKAKLCDLGSQLIAMEKPKKR